MGGFDRASGRVGSRRRGAAFLLTLATLLAACGASVAESPRTLRVVMADDWADTQVVADVVSDFESDHDGVRVALQGVPFHQVPTSVSAAADAGEPFDVAHWHAFAAAAQGLAQPLDELWETLEPETFVPGAVEDVTFGGRRYGLPLDTNALVLLTNAPALRERGLEPSRLTTFDALERAARAVAADGDYGVTVAASSWTAFGWIRANGGALVEVDEDGDPTFTLDAPEVVRAVDFLGGLIRSGGAPPPTARDMGNDGLALFQAGRALAHPSGSWDVEVVGEREDGAPSVPIEVVPMPRGPDADGPHTALGGSSLFVPTDSRHRDLASAFMTHLIRDEYALRLAREEGRLPVRRRVLEDPLFQQDPHLAPVVAQLEHASPMRLIAYPVATNAFRDAVESVLAREDDAAIAFARAQRIVESDARVHAPNSDVGR